MNTKEWLYLFLITSLLLLGMILIYFVKASTTCEAMQKMINESQCYKIERNSIVKCEIWSKDI